jgi:Calx-beta domain/HYR domain/Ricin-type beta-trefoil lectin domain-like/Secretion system C-terminal sorting domain
MNTYQQNFKPLFRWAFSLLLMLGFVFQASAQDPCANVTITPGNGTISVGGLNGAPIAYVQAYNSNWQQVFNCQGNCTSPTQLISSLPAGQYFVKVDLLNANYTAICKKEGYFAVTGTGGSCSLTYTSQEANKVCNNNGTPNNAADDTWTVNFTAQVLTNPNNLPVWGWNSIINGVGVSGMYGTPKALGPFPISAGSQSFVVNDDDNPSCKTTFTIAPPAACSNGGVGGTPDCNAITTTTSGNNIVLGGLTAPVTLVQVYNSAWAQIYNQTLNAPGTTTIPTVGAGTYFVKVDFLDATWQVICKKEQYVTVGGGGSAPTISINDVTVNENAGTATLQICASAASTSPITVQYTTSNGTALSGSDYVAASSTTATIPAGQTCVSVTFNITDDAANEPTEAFNVTLSSPSGATINDGAGTVTILDNDAIVGGTPDCNTITFTPSAGKITVGGLTAPIVLIQAYNAAWAQVFNQTYTSAPGSIMIPSLADGTYFVKVDFLNAQWAPICKKEQFVTVGGGVGNAPTVSISDVTVNENAGTATLQICASAASTSPITVQYTTSNGTAAAGTDYATTTSTATIPAGQTCVSVTFPILDDATNEPTELFNVTLSNPSGATIADGAGTVTILDNDAVAGPNCDNITITPGAGKITVGGLTAPIVLVQAYNAAWTQVFNQTYTAAPGSIMIPGLADGTYFVKVDFLTAQWAPICKKEQFVTVAGGTPAVLSLTCASDMNMTAAQGATSAVVNYSTPTGSTTCAGGAVNITRTSGLASGSAFPIGTTQVCYSATDNCGNVKTCCFNVTVNASTPTVLSINCAANVSATTAAGASTVIVNYAAPTASTTCAGGAVTVTRTSGLASGSAFPVGATQVCYSATDNCGNVKSCCFTVTVTAGGPSCAVTRTVSNSRDNCGAGNSYGIYFNVAYPGTSGAACQLFGITSGVFTENADGTAKFTGVATNNCNANIKFNVDVDLCGRTFAAPVGSPKTTTCYTANTNAWYYYTTICGTFTGTNGAAGAVIKVTRRGEAFQVGTGANLNEHVMGGSSWLNLYVTNQPTSGGAITAYEGDFNINLSGTPTAPACGTGTANCSTIACFTPPAFPNTGLCYRIVNKASGKVLDADYSPSLQQYTIDYSSSQRWKFENAGAGYFFINSQASALAGQNKVIDIANGSTADGALADLVTKTGAACEQYKLQDAGNGYYYIVAKHSGKALKLSANPGTNGTTIIQQTINSTNEHQKWQIVAIDCASGLQGQQEDLTFTATRKATSTKLNWLSNTGDKNDYFVVERSADATNFEAIAMVQGEGAKNEMLSFLHNDVRPLEGDNFYRLRLVYQDGTERFSDVQKVYFPTVKDFGVFPNPANENVFVELRPFEGEAVTLTVYNQLGSVVRILEVQKVDSNPAEINLTGIQDGFYTINIQSASGVKASRKLVVNQNR